ncbi:hypothetical protein GQ600_8732 [Phytophthora cactorum]|nr:hypothetical protein GQ600_8732 [Phytophthora cactorum]
MPSRFRYLLWENVRCAVSLPLCCGIRRCRGEAIIETIATKNSLLKSHENLSKLLLLNFTPEIIVKNVEMGLYSCHFDAGFYKFTCIYQKGIIRVLSNSDKAGMMLRVSKSGAMQRVRK